MPVPILEWFRHLRAEQKQEAAKTQQARGGQSHLQPSKRAPSQSTERHHLKEVDGAQRGDNDESDCEQARVERDQPLVRSNGRRHDGQCRHPENGFDRGSRVTNPHVCLVAPLLPALDDAVLWGAHELTTASGGAHQGDQCVQRHTGPDDLKQNRMGAGPPRPPSPRLGNHEADPGRNPDQDRQHRCVCERPGKSIMAGGHQQQGVTRHLDEH